VGSGQIRKIRTIDTLLQWAYNGEFVYSYAPHNDVSVNDAHTTVVPLEYNIII